MLFVSWWLIELKTYEKDQFDYELILVEQDEEEEIPLTEQIKTPPPPPVQAPTEIEIVEDEEEVEETIIESTETDRDEIIEVIDVVIEEEEEEIIDVPFAVIEDVPVFPGCEDVEKNQLRNCFQEQMNKHIKRNFRYPEIAQEMRIQGRVFVNFSSPKTEASPILECEDQIKILRVKPSNNFFIAKHDSWKAKRKTGPGTV